MKFINFFLLAIEYSVYFFQYIYSLLQVHLRVKMGSLQCAKIISLYDGSDISCCVQFRISFIFSPSLVRQFKSFTFLHSKYIIQSYLEVVTGCKVLKYLSQYNKLLTELQVKGIVTKFQLIQALYEWLIDRGATILDR